MVLPGHLAGGYLATHSILALSGITFPPLQTIILLTIGTIAGEFPDIDLLFFYFEYRKNKRHEISNHREYITHAPIFWLGISVFIALLGIIFGSIFFIFIGLAILVGSFSHFILDSIEFGVRWLWPMSNKRFCILNYSNPDVPGQKGTFSYYWRVITTYYIRRPTFYFEILITIIALIVLLLVY